MLGTGRAVTALAPAFAAQPAVFVAPQSPVELVVAPASAVAAALHTVAAAVSAAPRTRLVVSLLLVSRNHQWALDLVKKPVLVLEMAVSPPLLPAAWVMQVSHHPLTEGSVGLVEVSEL